jgi:protein SCO1/2
VKTLLLFSVLALALRAFAAEPKDFAGRGVVKEVRAAKSEVVVRHEEIPGYMMAMTMPFTVREPQLLGPLQPGDRISFRLRVTEREDWIDQIKVLSSGPPPAPEPPPAGPTLDPFQPGDPLPDLTFIDERGRPLRLAEFRGQALAFTFIYTRCPLPKFCPLLSQKFRAVQTILAADATAPRNWRLLSLTIDPTHDTPEALRQYATAQQVDPEHWCFATGELRDLTVLALRCGVSFWEADGTIVHNVRTVLVDPSGRVVRVIAENEWTPEEVARELRAAAVK